MKTLLILMLVGGWSWAEHGVITFHVGSLDTPPEIIVGPEHVKSAYVNENALTLNFTDSVAKQLETTTGANVGKKLVMAVDGKVILEPIIREKVSGGRVVIDGGQTPFWENHWLKLVISRSLEGDRQEQRSSVKLYVILAALVVAGALGYAFFPRRKAS